MIKNDNCIRQNKKIFKIIKNDNNKKTTKALPAPPTLDQLLNTEMHI